ncbi:MAG: tripartite tricarboxylate transporter substrate binding protein [Alphaproteobacteria bacterium]|nr:tripartite tricarboxylate transporter substrate binding protein [Alphaproteobacteria bacterium]
MKKLFVTGLVATGLLMTGAVMAAPKYADVKVPKNIQAIVAYNAGGSSDALARVMLPFWEKKVEELTGKKPNAIVVNLPGAGGEIGWTSLSYAKKDGSTIGVINLPAVPLVEAARVAKYAPWLEKFAPIGVNIIDPNVVRLQKDAKYATLKDAMDAAKAKPGSVTVGADGPLSDDHLAVYALAVKYGAEFTFVPYSGGAPANKAFQSGEVDIAVGNVFDHLKTKGSAKDVMVLRPSRYTSMDAMKDVKTAKETIGIDVGDLGSTRGWAAPAGIPAKLLTVYREAFAMAVNDPEYKKAALKRNITIVDPLVGDDFGGFMKDQQALVGDLLDLFVKGGYIKK